MPRPPLEQCTESLHHLSAQSQPQNRPGFCANWRKMLFLFICCSVFGFFWWDFFGVWFYFFFSLSYDALGCQQPSSQVWISGFWGRQKADSVLFSRFRSETPEFLLPWQLSLLAGDGSPSEVVSSWCWSRELSVMTPLTGAWWAPRDLEEPHTWHRKTVMMWDVERLALKTRRTGICGTQCPDCVLNRKPNVFLCITFSYKNILWSSGETKQNISIGTHCHLRKAKYVTLD